MPKKKKQYINKIIIAIFIKIKKELLIINVLINLKK